MAEPWLELDAVLRERLRDVLQEPPRPLTEAELRSLLEEGRACMLILCGELDRLERRLAQLDGDPNTSFSALTDAFRRVNEFRAQSRSCARWSPPGGAGARSPRVVATAGRRPRLSRARSRRAR